MTKPNVVNAEPTKEFFKSMLTRDIELKDAILDLLDNCIDGARRKIHEANQEITDSPYDSYWAHLTINKDKFIIEDNCGGIPLEIAQNYAFRFGRENQEIDEEIETVGMYGIGMKRAIFKLGTAATVTTKPTDNHCYKISILEDWHTHADWEFPLEDIDPTTLRELGTTIHVGPIHSEVQEEFDEFNSNFISDLCKTIETHYAYIIQKGFSISINKTSLKPILLKLALTSSIEPFVYEAKVNDIEIQLIVGFRSDRDDYFLPSEEIEDQEEESSSNNDSDSAGWTIICNDRVVLLNDKTHITGWGVGGVPKYHTQFIRISGVVEFHSKNAKNLPLTTTKRSVDLNSELYNSIRNIMMEGLKIFTSYTNHWKKHKDTERKNHLNKSLYTTRDAAEKILRTDFEKNKDKITLLNEFRKQPNATAKKFKPQLPMPDKSIEYKIIRFSKPESQIKELAKILFEAEDVPASEIGSICFDKVLEDSKR